MGGGAEIMVSRGWWQQNYGWSWMVIVGRAKLWLVVGGGDKIIADRGWLWVMATKLWLVVGGRGWLWVDVGGRRWSHDLVMLASVVTTQGVYNG